MTKKIDKGLEKWTDEEVLQNFSKFFDRVGLTSQFVENEDGLLTHQILVIQCGNKVIVSDPDQLEWPLQRMPMPEAFEGTIH